MNVSGEAADQVVKISLNGVEVAAKITGAAAKQIAVLIYTILKDQKKTRGKARLNSMLRSGKELKVFAVKQEDLKKFCQEAKDYGVLYCAIKNRDATDGVVDVMVRAEDASKVNRIFEKFTMSTVDIGTIKSDVEKSLRKESQVVQPDQEKTHRNPTTGPEEKSSPSEPISEVMPAARGTSDPNAKPSVKQALKDIRADQRKNAAQNPQQEKGKSTRTPAPKQGAKPKAPKGKGKGR